MKHNNKMNKSKKIKKVNNPKQKLLQMLKKKHNNKIKIIILQFLPQKINHNK